MMLFSVIAAIRSIPLCLAGCDVEISQIFNSLENRCVTSLLLTLDMYVLSVCCALKSHVNAFSSNFKRNPDFCKTVRDWSSRQSMLRRTCFDASSTLLTMITTVVALEVVVVIGGQLDNGTDGLTSAEILKHVPIGILAVSVVYTSFQAAQVLMCASMWQRS
jgi:hypothetical protein